MIHRPTVRRIVLPLLRNERGIAATEFAFILPVLVGLIMGVTEAGQRYLISDRMGSTVARLGDLITRERDLSATEIADMFEALPALSGDPAFANAGVVIVSGIVGERRRPPRVAWQRRSDGAVPSGSRIGRPGEAAALPAHLTLAEGETVIAVELFYRAETLFTRLASASASGGSCDGDGNDCVYKVSFHRGRLADLRQLGHD